MHCVVKTGYYNKFFQPIPLYRFIKPQKSDIMANEKKVKNGDKVSVHYTGTLETGEVFDSSENREPLEFEVGSGQVITGFDKAVLDMSPGEEKEILLEPDQAYGARDDKKMQKVPKEILPKDVEPKEGMLLTLKAPTGQVFPATIAKVEEKEVFIDLNHPLAGKKLKFKIKIEDIKGEE